MRTVVVNLKFTDEEWLVLDAAASIGDSSIEEIVQEGIGDALRETGVLSGVIVALRNGLILSRGLLSPPRLDRGAT